MISVCMITYGHELFIEAAIISILDQKSNYEVELIVANDCSPDKTGLIISRIISNHPMGSCIKYLNRSKNLGMIVNFSDAIRKCQGKYIALCEGDDYWTDPLKLQKQIDFLEMNPDYIGHAFNAHFNDERIVNFKTQLFSKLPTRNIEIKDLCPTRTFHTASFTFRKSGLEGFPWKYFSKNVWSGDKFLFLWIFLKGKIFYDSEVMAYYRRSHGGVSVISNREICYSSDEKMYKYFSRMVEPKFKKSMIEASNFYILKLFHFLLEGKVTVKLIYKYFMLYSVVGEYNMPNWLEYKKIGKKIIKRII